MPDFFCPLPWIHQFIQSTGIKCCCSNSTELSVDSTTFSNSAFINSVREDLLHNRVPDSCKLCVQQESAGFVSTRQLALKDWNYTKDNIVSELQYIDLRDNNKCNFRCRTCNPLYSTQIEREVHFNKDLEKFYTINNKTNNHTVKLDDLKVINLTGGEPLIIKEHTDILEKLVAMGKTDVRVLITTNGSTLNPKLMKLLSHFNNLHYTISIDGVGKVAEYVRDGTVWDRVNNNVNQFCNSQASVSINCTLSAYSILTVHQVAEHFKILKDKFTNSAIELMFSVVQKPFHLVPQALPTHLKPIAVDSIKKAIEVLKPIKTNPDEHLNTLNQLQKRLESITVHAQTKNFVEFTETLDRIRSQDFSTTFGVSLHDI